MKPLLVVALFVALVPAATAALGLPADPDPYTPSPAEQQRAVAALIARRALVSCGGGRADAVALTFDDGPGPYTERLLGILRRRHAHATFFVVGNRLEYWPAAVREERWLGAVGNHTWSHPALTRLPHWLVWLELLRTQYAVASETESTPTLFRTPYALHSPWTDAAARKLGLLQVFWDVDSGDSVPGASVQDIVRNVVRGLRPGAIVLMHDIHARSVAAVPRVLDALRARGLRAVSVPELLALDPPARGQPCPYGPVAGD